jgi:hypothetical protein
MSAAVKLGRYFEAHALAAFALMSEPPEERQARKLLAWIERKGLSRFTERDAYRDFSRGGRPADVLPGLRCLEDRGFVRRAAAEQQPGKTGRLPSPTFDVHPAVLHSKEASDDSDVTGESTLGIPASEGSVGKVGTSAYVNPENRVGAEGATAAEPENTGDGEAALL